MPKDAPDFSIGTVDLSPIAINTIPIVKNYPGGNVFFFDNFEGPNITWEILKELGGDYNLAEIDKTHAYIGTGCVRLYRNEDQDIIMRLNRRFQFRSSDTMGVDFSFMLSDIEDVRAEFTYAYKLGNTNYIFYIIFDKLGIIIYTSEGSYDYSYLPDNGLRNMAWNNVKVIINTLTHRYVRLYFGRTIYHIDNSALTGTDIGDEFPHLYLGFYVPSGGSAQKSLWLDTVILTDDDII